jgi:hypothetical protein
MENQIKCSRCGQVIEGRYFSHYDNKTIYCSECTSELLTPEHNSYPSDSPFAPSFIVTYKNFCDVGDMLSKAKDKSEYSQLIMRDLSTDFFCICPEGIEEGLKGETSDVVSELIRGYKDAFLKINMLSDFIDDFNSILSDANHLFNKSAALTTGMVKAANIGSADTKRAI